MTVVVFAGPSLRADDIRARLVCEVRPPAMVGDVLRAVREDARVIAIVDGRFDGVLPVWHKEILWALSQGVHVFGAASMGALRAAELSDFGMVGVGRIFEAYRSGELEADDEVALLHGPAEIGYAAVTEALVNVRATVANAIDTDVLQPDQGRMVLEVAASLHYRDRSWEAVLARFAGNVHERLRAWLPVGRVDQKRRDALELVTRLAEFAAADFPPFRAGFRFAWTDAWDALYRASVDAYDEGILDEIRLQPTLFDAVRRTALARYLATRSAVRPDDLPLRRRRQAVERLRDRLGLWRQAELDAWLGTRAMDKRGFAALAVEELLLEEAADQERENVLRAILDELRLSDDFPRLAQRARDKERLLQEIDLDTAEQSELDQEILIAELTAGKSDNRADLVRTLGFRDVNAAKRAILREIIFRRIIHREGSSENASRSAQPVSR